MVAAAELISIASALHNSRNWEGPRYEDFLNFPYLHKKVMSLGASLFRCSQLATKEQLPR